MADALLTHLANVLSSRRARSLDAPGVNPAAVLLLIYPKNGSYYIHMQKRARHLDQHAGEACFPGGSPEADDRDLLDTALREAHEEEAIRPGDVTVLGRLNDTPTRTGYSIKVFVGTIPHPYDFKPNPREVEEVVEVPLKALQDPANWREEARWRQDGVSASYAYAFGPHIIYGATANIIREFLEVIEVIDGVNGNRGA